MTKIVRFLSSVDDAPLDAAQVESRTRLVALTLDGLPPPRFAAVEVVWVDELVVALGATEVVVDEAVRRGNPSVTAPYRMMSVARRNPALSSDDFAERWRAESGRLGNQTIPDDIRGLAYVQNHPVGDHPFDAINEVWLDSLDALRRRAEWFGTRPVPADLFDPAESFALYLRHDDVLR